MKQFQPGDKVHYVGGSVNDMPQNGIFKNESLFAPGACQVVYESECKGDWENWDKYYGNLTSISTLREGWKK